MAKDGNHKHDKQVVEEIDYEQFAYCSSPLCSDISADSELEAAAAALAIKKLANEQPSNRRRRRHHHQTEPARKMDDHDEAESSFKLVPEVDPSDENKVAEVLVKLDQLDKRQPVQDKVDEAAESSFKLVPEADPSDVENKLAEVLVKLDQLDKDQAEPEGEKIMVVVNDAEEEPIDIAQSGETNQEEAAKSTKLGRKRGPPRTKNTTELIKTRSSGGGRGLKGRRKYQKPIWLPAQWQVQHITRQTGGSAGHIDTYYISPGGKRCRSKGDVMRFLILLQNADQENCSADAGDDLGQK